MELPSFVTRFVGAAALVVGGDSTAQVTLLNPNGGSFVVGQACEIQWRVVIAQSTLNWDLYYSTTGPGGPWTEIAVDLPPGDTSAGAFHTHVWTVPLALSNDVRVRVVQDNVGADHEDVSFTGISIDTPAASHTHLGRGCGVVLLDPITNWLPVLGATLASQVTGVQPTSVAVFIVASTFELPVPSDLGMYGMPGCLLYMPVDYAQMLIAVNGAAAWYVPIPNDPALIGAVLLQQAIVLDPAAGNAAGAVLTNATRAVISNRN